MSAIKKVVIAHQKYKGESVNNAAIKEKLEAQGKSTEVEDKKTKDPNKKDGYWVTLQDWSSCDKFCGAGTQSLHRMCIPPVNGGEPCKGDPILKKPCNLQPCPDSDNTIMEGDKTKKAMKTLKPKLKILPFSDRPQLYDKCHLKESDLLMTTEVQKDDSSKSKMKALQIPVRVVMNKNTITAYAGLDYTDKKISLDIQKVNFYISNRDNNCFELREPNAKETSVGQQSLNKVELCPFGTMTNKNTREEWDFDFHLFKIQCKESKGMTPVIDQKELDLAMNKVKNDLANKKTKKKLKDETQQISQLKEESIKALKKEMKLEEIIEDEMKESEEEKLNEKKNEMLKEQQKLECLNKAIKEKQLENEFNFRKTLQNERIESIKKGIADTISTKRDRLKEKLAKLKKLSEEKLKKADTQIRNIRTEMMRTIEDQEDDYDTKRCFEVSDAKNEVQYLLLRTQYCSKRVSKDPQDYKICKEGEKEQFMSLCCDYETNPNNNDDYKKCMESSKKSLAKDDLKNEDVRFFWAKPLYRNDLDLKDSGMKQNDQPATIGMMDPKYNINKQPIGMMDPNYNKNQQPIGMMDPNYNRNQQPIGMMDPNYNRNQQPIGMMDPNYNRNQQPIGMMDPNYNRNNPQYNNLGQLINGGLNLANQVGNVANNTINALGNQVVNGVANKASNMINGAVNTVNNVSNFANNAANTISNFPQNAMNSIGNQANNFVNGAVNTANNVSNTISNFPQNAVNSIGNKASNMIGGFVNSSFGNNNSFRV